MLKYHLNQYIVIQDSGSKAKLRKNSFKALNAISTRSRAIWGHDLPFKSIFFEAIVKQMDQWPSPSSVELLLSSLSKLQGL